MFGGLPVCFTNSIVSSGAFTPASLSLTGWWRAAYTGSPWTPTASAGASGSNGDLTSGSPPSANHIVNGYTAANFDAVNDFLSAAGTLDTFINANSWSCAFLIYADSVPTDPGNGARFAVANIAADSGAYFVIAHTTSGISLEMADGGPASTLTVPCSTGEWHLVQIKYDGANLYLRVDDGVWASQADGNIASLVNALHFGRNYNASALWDGKILEIMFSDTVLSDSTFDNILDYMELRYNLTLFNPLTSSSIFLQRPNYDDNGTTGTWTATVGTNATRTTDQPAETSGLSPNNGAPDFNGTTHLPLIATGTDLNTLLGSEGGVTSGTEQYFTATILEIDAISTTSATATFERDAAWTDNGAIAGLFFYDDAGTRAATAYHWKQNPPAEVNATVTGLTLNTRNVIFTKRNSNGSMAIAINNGSWTTGTTPTGTDLSLHSAAGTLVVGRDWNGGGELDGRIYALGLYPAAKDDTFRANFYNWAQNIHGAGTFTMTTNALHLIEPGQYNAVTPLWSATVGFSPAASITTIPPASSGDPDFSNHDLIGDLGDTISDFFPSATPFERSGFVVFTADTTGGQGAPWVETPLWADHGYGAIGMSVTDGGVGAEDVNFWYWYPSGGGGTTYRATRTFTLGARTVAHWRWYWNGTIGYIQIGVNGIWSDQVIVSHPIDPGVVTQRIKFGTNYVSSVDFDGRIHATGIYTGIMTDGFAYGLVDAYG